MDSLIKFRMLFDSLNSWEELLFMDKIIKSCGTELIKAAIFNHFAQKIIQFKPYNNNHIQTLNETLSDIIRSRKKPDKNENKIELKLDELPAPLISNISSYLMQTEYNKLQIANRKIFIGCNSPFSLNKIDLVRRNELTTIINPTVFTSITSLKITLPHFNKYINPNSNNFQFRNLKELILYRAETEDLEDFLNQKCINLANINHLTLADFGSYDYEISVEDPPKTVLDTATFLIFLSAFSNMQTLTFETSNTFFLDSEWDTQHIPFFPKLKAISCTEFFNGGPELNDVYCALINKHSKQIESLNWSYSGYDEINKLINLKEFKYSGCCNEEDFWKIANGTNMLNMVSVHFGYESQSRRIICVEKFINKLLTTQQNLRFIEIRDGVYEKNKINEIEKGIEVLKNMKKQEFTVRIHFTASDVLPPTSKEIKWI
eukprot:138843_1